MNDMNRKKVIRICMIASICICILAFYMRYGFISFETNDDEAMNLIAAGAYGPNSEYLVFIHILIGYILKVLYAAFPEHGCYALFFLVMNVSSIIIICCLLSDKKDIMAGISITLLLNIVLSKDYYRVLQFTKNASLYAAAGFLLMAKSEYQNKKYIAAGIFFLSMSFMTRNKQFIFMVPFAFLYCLWQLYAEKKEKRLSLLIRMGKALAPVGLVLLVLFAANQFAYRSEEWKEYWRYESDVSELLDFGMPRYAEAEAVYQSIGWTETDYNVFISWDYPDQNNIFSRANLETIIDMKTSDFNLSTIPDYFLRAGERICRYIAQGNLIVVFSLIVMMAGIAYGYKKRDLFPLIMTGCALSESLFLLFLHRINWRVEAGIWLVPCLYILYDMRNTEIRSHAVKNLALCGLIVLSAAYHYQSYVGMQTDRYNWSNNYENFFRTISEKYPDSFVFGESMSLTHRKLIAEPLKCDASHKDYYSNFGMLGGWEIPSPTGRYRQIAYGAPDTVKALLNDENVYFAAEEEKAVMLQNYLREYNNTIDFEMVDEIDGIQIWSVVRQ